MGQTIETKANEAILANDAKAIAALIKDYPDSVNMSMVNGSTNPLCRAVFNGRKEIVQILLDGGADFNQPSSEGRTPLIWSVIRVNAHLVDLLMERGADPSIRDNDGFNALDVAIWKINYELAMVFWKAGLRPTLDKRVYIQKAFREFDYDLFVEMLEVGRPAPER